jgi:ABC-2 type transport system permease protein
MKNDLRTVWALTRAFTKRYFRDKTALFFTFVFPLVFLMVFGTIFGKDSGPTFDIALINKSKTDFSSQFVSGLKKGDVFKITDTQDFAASKEALGRGEYDAIIELPETFGVINDKNLPTGNVVVYADQGDAQLSATLAVVLQGTLDGINNQLITIEKPFTYELKPIQTSNLTSFDYTFAGLLGFSLLSLGIFSMSEGFTGDKKAGALRRMQVAPIRSWQLIVATAINRILIGIISVVLMYIVALVMFDFNMRGDYISFALFTVASITCLFGFGMAVAGWAKDGNQAAPLSNLVSFPMMFLSGVFFPRFLMPEWLQSLTAYVPLTPVVDGFRMILTEGKTILEVGPQLAVIGLWTLIIYVVAFKVFRWE